jgi:glycosyltransferase involved in cell wall biosynthesis
MAPAVSVIMTVRNGAQYLPETLDALARQTFRNYELVINDNGSIDRTPSILADYAERDRRIRLLPPVAEGARSFTQGIARAFEAAIAPFVAVNDGDDVPAPDRLEKQAAVLGASPEITLVASWFDHIDSQGRVIETRRVPPGLFAAYQSGNPIAHSSLMYRRAEALAAGGYRERFTFASDFALQVAMALAGGKVAVIPESLVKIRLHEQQASRMPGQRAQFYREPLEILGAARRLWGVPWSARMKGMLCRQKLALRYGQALWNEKRHSESVTATPYWLLASLTSLVPSRRGMQRMSFQ